MSRHTSTVSTTGSANIRSPSRVWIWSADSSTVMWSMRRRLLSPPSSLASTVAAAASPRSSCTLPPASYWSWPKFKGFSSSALDATISSATSCR